VDDSKLIVGSADDVFASGVPLRDPGLAGARSTIRRWQRVRLSRTSRVKALRIASRSARKTQRHQTLA
jgi:hypothetical protein